MDVQVGLPKGGILLIRVLELCAVVGLEQRLYTVGRLVCCEYTFLSRGIPVLPRGAYDNWRELLMRIIMEHYIRKHLAHWVVRLECHNEGVRRVYGLKNMTQWSQGVSAIIPVELLLQKLDVILIQ